MSTSDPTQRFSDRVEAYRRYRPSYPPEVLDLLVAECELAPGWVVADIGSGTGILSRIFLDRGYRVFGVEPNRQMRRAGEKLLAGYPGFTSVAGSAESTRLPDHGIDLIAAAQAFHWFEPRRTRAEFLRILRPSGWLVLAWNERRKDSSAFLRDYERLLLNFGTDYRRVDHSRITHDELQAFFGARPLGTASFEYRPHLDFEGVQGRLLSTSYAPGPGHPYHTEMLRQLRFVFNRHERDGKVEFEYDTRVFYGRLT
jgi:SAM-dependent methyltransferase